MKPIKDFTPENQFFLAPMEAVNCASFRLLCKERGAALVFTDMIDADVFIEEVKKTSEEKAIQKYVNPQENEQPLVIQLGGAKIENLKQTINILEPFAAMFDLNIGCPLGYMLGKKGGVYLMKHPDQLYKLVSALRKHIKKPFSVKIRAGWDENSINAVDIAIELEKIGVDMVTIHPRTRKQRYQDRADWPLVRQVAEKLSIPVCLSGDVTNAYMAHMAFAHTKCDYIMIGRGAKNNPSVFKELQKYDGTQPEKPNTTYNKQTEWVKEDWKRFIELYTTIEHRNNFSEILDHALWTARECKDNKLITHNLMKCQTIKQINTIIEKLRF